MSEDYAPKHARDVTETWVTANGVEITDGLPFRIEGLAYMLHVDMAMSMPEFGLYEAREIDRRLFSASTMHAGLRTLRTRRGRHAHLFGFQERG